MADRYPVVNPKKIWQGDCIEIINKKLTALDDYDYAAEKATEISEQQNVTSEEQKQAKFSDPSNAGNQRLAILLTRIIQPDFNASPLHCFVRRNERRETATERIDHEASKRDFR